LGALYKDAEFVSQFDTSDSIWGDIALYSKIRKAEADVNRLAHGIQDIIDKGKDADGQLTSESRRIAGMVGFALAGLLILGFILKLFRKK